MRHLLGIADLSRAELYRLLGNARSFIEVSDREFKKVPALRGKTIINLFLEASTRTRTSFEIAGKRLSADTVNISGSGSSMEKGETLLDTARTLGQMNPDAIVVRHRESGAPHFLARFLGETPIVNAGDGMHEHPTQALLDCLTLLEHFSDRRANGIEGLTVVVLGDIRHSRVARSTVLAHRLLGNQVRLVGPATLVPRELSGEKCFGKSVTIAHSLAGLEGADVVVVLRMQLERQNENFLPSLDEYSQQFCLSEAVMRKYAPNGVVLHPGPMNRGVEIASELADGPRSLIGKQVTNGVAVRMAVLFELICGGEKE